MRRVEVPTLILIATLALVTLMASGCGAGNGRPPLGARFGSTIVFPTLTSISPDTALVGTAAFVITVNGTNFGPDATVFWNGLPLPTRFISSKQLVAQVSATNLQFAGPASVFVRSAGMNSNTVTFAVNVP
ncbi:MAG TPA: IPT/TIG domain-containing protein [Terriglobales bacterium]|nr:IPT/TIG domain-containing protein [Terriglobales bacterium]